LGKNSYWTISENKMGHNTTMCGIHKYLKECKACLVDPVSTDGSIHPTIGLKVILHINFMVLLVRFFFSEHFFGTVYTGVVNPKPTIGKPCNK